MSPFYGKLVRAGIPVTVVTLAVVLSISPRVRAAEGPDDVPDPRIQLGLSIAPVPLNLHGKDQALVGLGSYLVNAVGDCNGCHSNGPPTQFAPGGNPFFGQPKKTNPTTYLGGGRVFAPLVPGSASIVSRNLTPDKTGLAEGGHTLAEFTQILRTGVDLDNAHPTCPGAPNANCVPPPFDGSLLQIMPWPSLKDLTDHDISAMYEYLGAIPCVEGGPGEPPNRCSLASARVIWIQPGSLAGFGDAGALVIAGNALGPVPAGLRVTLYWQDKTAGTPWTAAPYAALPDSKGIWYNEIPPANVTLAHQYLVYATYGDATSASCTYLGNSAFNSCP
jgi:hypothetical protein